MAPMLKKRRVNKIKTNNTRHKRPKKAVKLKRKPPTGEQYLALIIMSSILLTASIVTYLSIYSQGIKAQKNAEALLSQYNALVSSSPAPETAPKSTAEPSPTQAAPTEEPQVLIYVDGYDIVGKLTIDDLQLELPVISEMTKSALKISVCYYQSALPGEMGNMIITGHNYVSGAHFGDLNRIEIGDLVDFLSTDGTVYHYQVYETLRITPDDSAALFKYRGDYGLTLFTCASSGNRRFVVRCALIN